jgi:site-specific recombinase XerD
MNAQPLNIMIDRNNDLMNFRAYLIEKENSEATIKKYVTDIENFYRFLNGREEICKNCVLEYKEWLCRNYATSSVNSMLAALNQFLIFIGAGVMRVKRLKVQRNPFLPESRLMTKEEYLKLIKTARARGKKQLELAMESMASTGARVSELDFFTVDRVRKGSVEIVNKGKHRTILIPEKLKKKILIFTGSQGIQKGLVFRTRTGKMKDRSNIWKEMKALQKESGVDAKKIFPHNLRHLFARLFYKKTRDIVALSDILGHSSINVTRIYTADSIAFYKQRINGLELLLE